jgi:hypothetical protein
MINVFVYLNFTSTGGLDCAYRVAAYGDTLDSNSIDAAADQHKETLKRYGANRERK